jgi:hypothetical protein
LCWIILSCEFMIFSIWRWGTFHVIIEVFWEDLAWDHPILKFCSPTKLKMIWENIKFVAFYFLPNISPISSKLKVLRISFGRKIILQWSIFSSLKEFKISIFRDNFSRREFWAFKDLETERINQFINSFFWIKRLFVFSSNLYCNAPILSVDIPFIIYILEYSSVSYMLFKFFVTLHIIISSTKVKLSNCQSLMIMQTDLQEWI